MLHMALNDRLRVLPAQARAAFVRQAASWGEDFCGRLALYWLPVDTARRILDAALGEARRRGLFAPLERPAYRRSKLLGTLPDGTGAQSLTAVLEGGDGPAAARF